MRVDEVLLAALAESFRRWTGASCVQVDLEGHGREDVLEGVDLSRTVGWFTSLYPVLLETGTGQTPESGLKAIKESLRRIPQRGLGFGVARYLSREPELTERLRALPASEVAFNYLGQFDNVLPAESPLVLASERWARRRTPRPVLSHRISINALISGGCSRCPGRMPGSSTGARRWRPSPVASWTPCAPCWGAAPRTRRRAS
jgi:hypothetical protein